MDGSQHTSDYKLICKRMCLQLCKMASPYATEAALHVYLHTVFIFMHIVRRPITTKAIFTG